MPTVNEVVEYHWQRGHSPHWQVMEGAFGVVVKVEGALVYVNWITGPSHEIECRSSHPFADSMLSGEELKVIGKCLP